MNNANAIEAFMPVVQPADLWQERVVGSNTALNWRCASGRDRGDRPFVLGPTYEEVITDLIRNEISCTSSQAAELLPDPDQVP